MNDAVGSVPMTGAIQVRRTALAVAVVVAMVDQLLCVDA